MHGQERLQTGRQGTQDLAEPREDINRLELDALGPHHPGSRGHGAIRRSLQQRGLADPRLACEHQRTALGRCSGQELVDQGQLGRAPRQGMALARRISGHLAPPSAADDVVIAVVIRR